MEKQDKVPTGAIITDRLLTETERQALQDSLCPLCGGVMTNITHYIQAGASTEPLIALIASGHLCYGHPAPKRHDGKLDETKEWFHAYAEQSVNVKDDLSDPKISGIHLHGGYGDCEGECMYLDAKQALSLLAWLEQERPKLEQLAQEQQ